MPKSQLPLAKARWAGGDHTWDTDRKPTVLALELYPEASAACEHASLLAPDFAYPSTQGGRLHPRVGGTQQQQEILMCAFLFLGFRPQNANVSGPSSDRTWSVIVAWALPLGNPQPSPPC